MKKFHYNDLLSGNYTTEDEEIIKEMDKEQVEMYIDDHGRVFTESDVYIADVKKYNRGGERMKDNFLKVD